MNNVKKIIKLIYIISIVFLIFNVFVNNSVFATGGNTAQQQWDLPEELATPLKAVIVFVQIFITGAITIKLSLLGIQYFTAVGADVKAANKRKIVWTLIIGAIVILGIWIFGKLLENA